MHIWEHTHFYCKFNLQQNVITHMNTVSQVYKHFTNWNNTINFYNDTYMFESLMLNITVSCWFTSSFEYSPENILYLQNDLVSVSDESVLSQDS